MKNVNIVSLFDGMSCGQVSISNFLTDYNYFSSEIDKHSIRVTQHNFPNTTQLGDVRNINNLNVPNNIFLLMGGAPCVDISVAGKRKGMTTKEGQIITSLDEYLKMKNDGMEFQGQSYLFWEFVRVLKEHKPKYFLLENVHFNKKMKHFENIVSEVLGVKPIEINSSLVSGQNRKRLYWTNIPNVSVPEDKGITLGDLIPNAVTGCGFSNKYNPDHRPDQSKWSLKHWTDRKDGKANCLTKSGHRGYVRMTDGSYRKLTSTEREMLQTLPNGYTNVPKVSETQKLIMMGNGWTVDVIKHIMSYIPEFQNNVLRKVS